MKSYPRLDNEDFFHFHLGMGAHGSVHTVQRQDGLVAKVYSPKNNWLAEHEYDIANRLYWGGVSVPRPKGVYTVSFWGGLLQKPAFVMERIHAPRLDHLLKKEMDYSQRKALVEKLDVEVNKARDLGFFPGDATPFNAFYSVAEDRIILFDFSHWRNWRRDDANF